MYIIQLVNVEMNTSSMYKTWWIWTTKMAVSLVTSVFSPNFYEKLDIWDTTISCVQAAEVDARKFDSLCRWNGSWGPQTLGVARGVHVAPALRVALGVPPTKMHGGFVSRIYHAKRWEHPSISTGVVYPWRIRMYAIWMDTHFSINLPYYRDPMDPSHGSVMGEWSLSRNIQFYTCGVDREILERNVAIARWYLVRG